LQRVHLEFHLGLQAGSSAFRCQDHAWRSLHGRIRDSVKASERCGLLAGGCAYLNGLGREVR
jgi:hypothetical protein